MKLPQVLLTVVLVAAGIFAYDVLIRSERPTGEVAGTQGVHPAPAPTAEAPAPIRLEGSGAEYWRAEMERRLGALEEEGGTRSVDVVPDAGILEAGAAGWTEPLPENLTEVLERATGRTFDAKDVAAFRALLDHVEKQRQEERMQTGVSRYLDRLDLNLSDAQREAVFDAAVAFQDKARDLRASGAGATREERRETFQNLRDELQTEISKSVPVSDAETIVNGLMRVTMGGGRPGGGPPGAGGRGGRSRPGGTGGTR